MNAQNAQNAQQILHDYLYEQPEHPIPYAGDVVHLVYPPKPGTIGIVVNTQPDDIATFTIAVPADLMAEAINDTCLALVRSSGGNATSAGTVEALREKMGVKEFDERVGNLTRLQFVSVSIMRTGILPFLAPRLLESGAYREGHDYSFQAQITLRPHAELTDYAPAKVELPTKPEVSDRDVNDRINQMMGGDIPWDEVHENGAGSNIAKMREEVRKQLEQEAENNWQNAASDACADAMASRLTKTPPSRHVELMRDAMANSYATNIVDQGQDWDEYIARPDFDLEEFKSHMTDLALSSLRRGMVYDAVADHYGIMVTEQEVRDAVSVVARGHIDEAIDGMLRNCQLPQLLESTRRIKTGDTMVRMALEAGSGSGSAKA